MTRQYKPRRASRKFLDADCPKGVLWISDHPKFDDRYTVYYADPICGTAYRDTWIGYRSMSENPFHPQGIGIYGEIEAHHLARYRMENYHRSARWSDLPEKVRQCVLQDLAQ